ncbi:MAG: hypothetical protein AAFY50_24425 [Cyanobacteria bacterium J06648_1]
MNLDSIPQESQKLMNQVTNAVEKTGKKVANQVSNIANGKGEEITEDAIQAAVDQALDVIQVAGARVREKNLNAERVTLEVGVGVVNVAHLKITTDIPGTDSAEEVDVELS